MQSVSQQKLMKHLLKFSLQTKTAKITAQKTMGHNKFWLKEKDYQMKDKTNYDISYRENHEKVEKK